MKRGRENKERIELNLGTICIYRRNKILDIYNVC